MRRQVNAAQIKHGLTPYTFNYTTEQVPSDPLL